MKRTFRLSHQFRPSDHDNAELAESVGSENPWNALDPIFMPESRPTICHAPHPPFRRSNGSFGTIPLSDASSPVKTHWAETSHAEFLTFARWSVNAFRTP